MTCFIPISQQNIKKSRFLPFVDIRIVNTDKAVITDNDGRFDIAPLSMGSYTAIIEKEGYETLTLTFDIKTGVMTGLNGALKMVV